jgi:hypothetical protein
MAKEDSANTSPQVVPMANDTLVNRAIDKITDVINMPSVPKEERLANLTEEQQKFLQEVIERTIRESYGQLDEIESALGMLLIGHHVGWKVLYLIHSKKTIRKYEDILGIKIREVFPERGPSSPRSVGLYLADKVSNFWKVVSGDIKIPDQGRRTIK